MPSSMLTAAATSLCMELLARNLAMGRRAGQAPRSSPTLARLLPAKIQAEAVSAGVQPASETARRAAWTAALEAAP